MSPKVNCWRLLCFATFAYYAFLAVDEFLLRDTVTSVSLANDYSPPFIALCVHLRHKLPPNLRKMLNGSLASLE